MEGSGFRVQSSGVCLRVVARHVLHGHHSWRVEGGECGMECGVWSVECGVWSVECGVWSVECGVWSVECRVWSVEGSGCKGLPAGRCEARSARAAFPGMRAATSSGGGLILC